MLRAGALWTRFEPLLPPGSRAGVDATRETPPAARDNFPAPVCRAGSGAPPFAPATILAVLPHVVEYLPEWLMRSTLEEAARVAPRVIAIVFHVPPAGTRKTRIPPFRGEFPRNPPDHRLVHACARIGAAGRPAALCDSLPQPRRSAGLCSRRRPSQAGIS